MLGFKWLLIIVIIKNILYYIGMYILSFSCHFLDWTYLIDISTVNVLSLINHIFLPVANSPGT